MIEHYRGTKLGAVIALGDNFYNNGVQSSTDALFTRYCNVPTLATNSYAYTPCLFFLPTSPHPPFAHTHTRTHPNRSRSHNAITCTAINFP